MSLACLTLLRNIQTMARKKCEEKIKISSGYRTHDLLIRNSTPYPLRQPIQIVCDGSLKVVSYTEVIYLLKLTYM